VSHSIILKIIIETFSLGTGERVATWEGGPDGYRRPPSLKICTVFVFQKRKRK